MRKGFTLAELLIAIAVLAVLLTVTILLLNPPALLQEARDATRASDIKTLAGAATTYYSDTITNATPIAMGSSSVVYVSIPDPNATSTAGDQCQGLNLPTLSGAWSYHCAASSTYRRTDGTGWVPINFNAYSGGSLLTKLPVDPTNTTSTDLYYTYETDGLGGYKFSAFFESQKDAPLMASDGGGDPELYEKGTNLALGSGRGLVGYWAFDEGSGNTALDGSGYGNSAGWSGSTTAGSYYAAGRVGAYDGNFNGTNDYLLATTSASLQVGGAITIAAWIHPANFSTYQAILVQGNRNYSLYLTINNPSSLYFQVGNGGVVNGGISQAIPTSTWSYLVATLDGAHINYYLNGVNVGTYTSAATSLAASGSLYIGSDAGGARYYMSGPMDDVKIYNRALSATEIQEMYNAEK
jgi:prepilin-type N-terminal cleavage/methylation domain-containing protein